MYKKITLTKGASTPVASLNDQAREKIKDFMISNGWTLDGSKSNGCNYCLYKNFSNQNDSPSNGVIPLSFPYFLKTNNNSNNEAEEVDCNGTFHFSISKPLHNSRVLSLCPYENPSTYFGMSSTWYNVTGYSQYDKVQGYNCSDTEITKLCTQDPSGYSDSGDRYDTAGLQKNVAFITPAWKTTERNYWKNPHKIDQAPSNWSKPLCDARIDEQVTEVQIEMFYFTDSDLQEEFYFVIRTDKLFGRIAPPGNMFYQTVGFVKIPGYPMMCSSSIYESLNASICSNNTKITFKVQVDSDTGVKGFVDRCDLDGDFCKTGYWDDLLANANLSTTDDVTSDWNPRWDAPDTTPDLWLHHTVGNYNSQPGNSRGGSHWIHEISSVQSEFYNRRNKLKIFANWNFFILPYFKTTVNNVEHTVYSLVKVDNLFGSYEFIYDKSCSSKTGTSLLVPIQRVHQTQMFRNGPRHIKWYNMFYSAPEKVLEPTHDDISAKWKAYPLKRRSIQGYVDYVNKDYINVYWTNPVDKSSWHGDKRYYNSSTEWTNGNLYWFKEDDTVTKYTTGQPILSDYQIGAELDASGFEGFAIDYSEYSETNVETIEL